MFLLFLLVMRFAPKLLDKSDKTCSISTEEGCTSNANYMLLTNEGIHLCISSTIPNYLFQAAYHLLLPSSKEVPVLNLQADHGEKERL